MRTLLVKLTAFVHTKAALALLGAALLAGGGAAVAMAATHGNPGQLLSSFAPATHTPHGTPQDDQGDHASAEGTLTNYTAPSGSTPGTIIVKQADGTSVTFAVTSDTRVNGTHANTLADLPGVVGSQVQVQAEQQGSGTPLAVKITVQGPANSVELHGTVASVNVTGNSFVLTTESGPVTITITPSTTFAHDDGGLAGLHAGDQVNVQGVRQPDNSVVATHIEVTGSHGPHGDGTPEATETEGSGD